MGEACHGCRVRSTWKSLSQPPSAACWPHPSQAMPAAAPFAFLAKQPWCVHLWFLGSANKTLPCLLDTAASHSRTFLHPPSPNYSSATPAPCDHQSKAPKVLQWAHQLNDSGSCSRERNNLWYSIKLCIKSPIHLWTPKASLLSTYTFIWKADRGRSIPKTPFFSTSDCVMFSRSSGWELPYSQDRAPQHCLFP